MKGENIFILDVEGTDSLEREKDKRRFIEMSTGMLALMI